MYSNQKTAFDTLLFWMVLLLPLLAVEGSNVRYCKSNNALSQVVNSTKEYSKLELPDKEKNNPVQLKKQTCINDKDFPKAFFESLIVKWYKDRTLVEPQLKRGQPTTSQGPDQKTVPIHLELLNDPNLQNLHAWTLQTGRSVVICTWHLQSDRFKLNGEAGTNRIEGCCWNDEYQKIKRITNTTNRYIDSKQHIIELENLRCTLQLSNKYTVYLGATKRVSHFPLYGSEIEDIKNIASYDLTAYFYHGIIDIVSRIYFAISFDSIAGRLEFLGTLFFVHIKMLHNVAIITPAAEGFVIIDAWMLSCLSLVAISLLM
jgi:hypothetical protein